MGRTRYLATTRRRSTTSATTRSSGWTRTSSRRWTSSRRSRRRWRPSATRSSPSSTEHLEALTWEVWEVLLEVHLVLELVVKEVLDQLLRKSTKSNLCNCVSSSATAKLN